MKDSNLKKTYEKYSEYKDSGAEWLGKIPNGWKAQKIVSVFDFPNEKVTELNFEPLSVTYGGIKKQIETAAKVAEGSSRKLVKVGDIVINARSDRKGAVGMSEYEGAVSLVYNILRKRNKEIDSKYFHYLFRSQIFSEEFYRWGRGIVDDLWTTRANEMKRILIPVPQVENQAKIVDFLDEKTSFIDQIIEKKKKLIELLKEKRTAIINQAVTKGLDPKAELVDSGIDWIGKIPKGWKISRIKHLSKLLSGFAFASESYLDEGLPIIRITDVKPEINIDKLPKVPFSLKPILSAYRTQKNDNLIAMTGATIGKSCFISSDDEMYVNQRVSIVRSGKQFAKYIFNSINANGFKKYIDFLSNGGAQQNISNYDIGNFRIAISSYEKERDAIIETLEKKMEQFSKTLERVEKSVDILGEFKSSLISNVVTGKVKI